MKKLFLIFAAGAVLVVAAPATAQYPTMYGGLHPINPAVGGGFCYQQQPHSHPYGIDSNLDYLFRNVGGYQQFAGDPYQFGYQGQAFPYYGNHPLPSEFGATYCYLDGAHYHHFVPPAGHAAYYVVNGGHYYYQGGFPAWYHTYRPNYYRSYHSYRYLPAYRAYHNRYLRSWRAYARPANVHYFRNRPSIVYRYARPPVHGRNHRAWWSKGALSQSRPVYRYRPGSRPIYRQPTNRRPAYRQPASRRPTYQRPVYRQPANRRPVYRRPVYRGSAQRRSVPSRPSRPASGRRR